MTEMDKKLDLQIDHRGAEMLEIENTYLDGQFDIESIKRRILQSKAIIGQGIYCMGRDLVMLKENCTHGDFIPHLNDLGITRTTARRYMSIALKFNTPKLQQLVGSLNGDKGAFSKLLDLSTEGDEDLEKLLDGGTVAGLQLDDIERMSASELRTSLRKANDTAKADLDAKEELLLQKNLHADQLAEKLSKAQGIPQVDRWTEAVATYRKDLTVYGLDAEELLSTVNNLILCVEHLDCPDDAKKSMALHTTALVNQLGAVCGQLQMTVFEQFSDYINQPTYSISDPLTIVDDDQVST